LSDLRGRDPLTGLVSRETLEEELAATVSGAEAAGRSVCVAYLGLDGFRAINDAYGMRVGDAVLKEIATRLSDWLGGKPQVTRVGGDEFALFCKCDAAGLDELARTLQRTGRSATENAPTSRSTRRSYTLCSLQPSGPHKYPTHQARAADGGEGASVFFG
jgi:diguanylate cyclase (GGDEF)-like protein